MKVHTEPKVKILIKLMTILVKFSMKIYPIKLSLPFAICKTNDFYLILVYSDQLSL